ncbi:hypothetical protein Cgig2_018028 [Carnegiea gigantea]|uniref:Uncharacterized protein n=1 Tax=Carnegiea gigantea TaxID=171969 RepID=A0A9Q1JYY5_9CARY|nr:hypothetical protein Cgig2_018028 [Carnegiea gigantea]
MGESCPKLLDLIPKEREWGMNREGDEELGRKGSPCDENKKLELRLGLPGDEGWCQKNSSKTRERNGSLLSLNNHFPDQKRALPINNRTPWPCSSYHVLQAQQQQSNTASPFLVHHHHNHQYQTSPNALPAVTKESSQRCCTRIVDLQNAEKKAISPPSANTDVPNASQKRGHLTEILEFISSDFYVLELFVLLIRELVEW